MKWIGQNIYDQISRFRNDVYLEDISTGTIASGAHLGLDSNNKIVKAADGGGDLTSIVAGTGLSGTSLTGPIPTLNIDAAQTSITSLGTLTALTVDNIGIDGDTITASGDLAIVATGNDISVDTDNLVIESAADGKPLVTLKTTHTTKTSSAELQFLKDAADTEDGENLGIITFYGENESNANTKFAHIKASIAESDDGAEGGSLRLAVATHDGEIRNGLIINDGNAEDEIDVTIGDTATSLTTIAGTLTMGSTATINNSGVVQVAAQTVIDHDQLANFAAGEHFTQANITTVGTIGTGVWNGTAIAHAYIGDDAIDGDNIADDAVDSEHYTDGSIDTAHIADDQVTFAKASGVTPNVYGNVIKLLPSDFATNGDGGNTKTGIMYVDTAGTGYGMRVPNNSTELYAFVSIPEGMKATHVDIHDKSGQNLAVEVFEIQINATTMVSKGTGNANTTIDITDVNATATNLLAIEVTTTSTGDRVYGGSVTIAAQ